MVQVFLGTDNTEFDWETEFNRRVDENGKPIRDYAKGWYYVRNGELHFSKGQQGHFIYQKLLDKAKENMQEWIVEYIISNLE